ncbi:hypothetical protein WI41_19935 [Burkholderia latens]|uniref:Uncharacterized protein n=1 Tax=Burkholderia latens TaxID=488446 RepID=A0AAP1C4V5_9BURK|nr:hypothetical protein WI41_19935 [Burkholderia latens]
MKLLVSIRGIGNFYPLPALVPAPRPREFAVVMRGVSARREIGAGVAGGTVAKTGGALGCSLRAS